jgi:transcription initiation factor TFIIIB Brf1 subunit/transcription initiation factor TFIIB
MTLNHEFTEIDAMCCLMNLTKEISDTTKQLYKKASDEKLPRGRSKTVMYAACIYCILRVGSKKSQDLSKKFVIQLNCLKEISPADGLKS